MGGKTFKDYNNIDKPLEIVIISIFTVYREFYFVLLLLLFLSIIRFKIPYFSRDPLIHLFITVFLDTIAFNVLLP